ncbi:MAG: hypothetical protein KDA52_20835, partial [Planctomycetaceae bacterium]|nr:hypothetical protein [Planctomycetaceae bacterium]
APVLNSHFGYVPPIRLWVLFQVDNDFSAKKAWQRLPQWWRIHFAHCDDLDGASIFSDTELFSDEFVGYINTGINSC